MKTWTSGAGAPKVGSYLVPRKSSDTIGAAIAKIWEVGLHGVAARLARLYGYYCAHVGTAFHVHIGSVPVSLDLRVPMERHLFLGDLEREVLEMYLLLLKEGDIVFDIGANIGFHAATAAALVGEAGRVYALEPGRVCLERLFEIACHNPLRNIEVLPLAASDRPADRVLFVSSVGALSSLEASWSPSTTICQEKVRCITLDELVDDKKIDRIRLIKVDVEGHEEAVLLGAKRYLPLLEWIA